MAGTGNGIVIVSAARTPVGSFNGSLSSVPASFLGSVALKAALERAKVEGAEVDDVILGQILTAGQGQNPARQASVNAGIPKETPAWGINQLCGSGLRAVALGMQQILSGDAKIVAAGGQESMSRAPHAAYLREGVKMGDYSMVDTMIKDGLWDVYHQYHMGNAAELCARDLKISREDQDAYAIESYRRATTAWQQGKFAAEIAPVQVPGPKGSTTAVTEDEDYTKVNFDKIPGLKPVFEKEGTVTAANASNLNDGASALVLMSYAEAQARGLQPLARILGYADAQQAPEWFTTAPSKAIPLAMQRAGITAEEVDFYEINEAFSVVCVANNRLLNLDPNKVNVYGGGVSIGHPIGSSGCRILVTLCSVLRQENGRIGVAGICNGGGGASAVVLERL